LDGCDRPPSRLALLSVGRGTRCPPLGEGGEYLTRENPLHQPACPPPPHLNLTICHRRGEHVAGALLLQALSSRRLSFHRSTTGAPSNSSSLSPAPSPSNTSPRSLPEVQIHPGFDWLPRLVVVSKPYLTSLRWIVLALAASLLFFCASNSAQIRLSGLDTQILRCCDLCCRAFFFIVGGCSTESPYPSAPRRDVQCHSGSSCSTTLVAVVRSGSL